MIQCDFGRAATEKMRIDSSGDVQLRGSTDQRIRLNTSGAGGNDSVNIRGDGNALKYNTAAGTTGLHLFENNGNELMRIDSVGRMMIGTTTRGQNSSDDLTIGDGSTDTGISIRSSGSTTGNLFFSRSTGQDATSYAGYIQYQHSANRMYFGTSSIGKLLIGQYGFIHAGNDGTFTGDLTGTSSYHSFDSNIAQWTFNIKNRSSQPYGLLVNYTTTPNNTSSQFIYCSDSTAKRYAIRSNGVVESYGSVSLSDEREKKNISDLDAKWDKVKSWDLKKFHFNEDEDTDDLRYGVIAQQIEPICPEVIDEWEKQKGEDAVLDENDEVVTPAKEQIMRKSVKSEQMMWMAIKALQEAQTRIETLETQNADLLARVTALEG